MEPFILYEFGIYHLCLSFIFENPHVISFRLDHTPEVVGETRELAHVLISDSCGFFG